MSRKKLTRRTTRTAGWSRRGFLKALGAAAIAAPFAQLVKPAVAHATGSGHAKRVLIMFTPNGTIHDFWRPTGSGRGYSFEPGSIMEPLQDWRSQMCLIDGIDFMDVSNHEGGMASMLTGTPGGATRGMSIDQYLAAEIGTATRFSSLEAGVLSTAWGVNTQTVMSYGADGAMVPPDDDPMSVYRRLFGEVGGSTSEAPDRALLRRQSILDNCVSELQGLQTQVGYEEGQKLEQHLDAVRAVERRMQAPAAGGELSCETPPMVMELDKWQNDNFPAIGRMQTDMVLTALQCGITNVATLQWSHTVGPVVFNWLDGVQQDHHQLSHWDAGNPAMIADFVRTERWYAEQFRYVLERLSELPEPGEDGTMLDHSLIVWAQELGDGRLHECRSVPFVLAGGAGGFLELGQYVDLGGAPHQRLLVTIAQAMGLDLEVFGTAAHGVGGISEVQA